MLDRFPALAPKFDRNNCYDYGFATRGRGKMNEKPIIKIEHAPVL